MDHWLSYLCLGQKDQASQAGNQIMGPCSNLPPEKDRKALFGKLEENK